MSQQKGQLGFTLVEMIGVLAVIALLAAIIAPRIIEVMRDARISKVLEDTHTLTATSAEFFKDTGILPANNAVLITNPATPIAGWKGPYIEKSLRNPWNATLTYTMSAPPATGVIGNNFDLDGDGSVDFPVGRNFSYFNVQVPNADVARRISDAIDRDGDNTAAGNNAWYRAGKVKTPTGAAPPAANPTLVILLGSA